MDISPEPNNREADLGEKMPCLLVVIIEIDLAHTEEFNRWYDEEHFPERMACPGFLSGRRFRSMEHPAKYLALYEIDGEERLQTKEYLKVKVSSPWRERTHEFRLGSERELYVEIPTSGAKPDLTIDQLLERRPGRVEDVQRK
jgi:hypothetical protein